MKRKEMDPVFEMLENLLEKEYGFNRWTVSTEMQLMGRHGRGRGVDGASRSTLQGVGSTSGRLLEAKTTKRNPNNWVPLVAQQEERR